MKRIEADEYPEYRQNRQNVRSEEYSAHVGNQRGFLKETCETGVCTVYRGQRVRVSGVLRKSVVTEADVDPLVANRGAGTFYSLHGMKYELLK